MTANEALIKLGELTAEPVLRTMLTLCPDGAGKGKVSVMPTGVSPLESLTYPLLATNVSYVDGVVGGNVFVITRLGARRLAASMMFQEPPTEDIDQDLDELELSALSEAMNQMMGAAAAAIEKAVGYHIEIGVPETRVLNSAADGEAVFPRTPHAISVTFMLLGEPCRLLQLIPDAFVVRMTKALEGTLDVQTGGEVIDLVQSYGVVRGIRVRVTAELGRATMPLAQAVGLRPGTVVELDRAADDPVDLYVNGQHFATGQLLEIQSQWAVRIEHVVELRPAYPASNEGGI